MPVVRESLDMSDVAMVLRRKGYGFHSTRQYPVQLNVASKTHKRQEDGTPYRELLRGIGKDQVDHILRSAESVEEAALWFERLSLGEPLPQHGNATQASEGLTADQLAHIIENRVQASVANVIADVDKLIAQTRREMSEAVAQMRELLEKAVPKADQKKQRKKTGTIVRTDAEIDALLDSMNLPTGNQPQSDE